MSVNVDAAREDWTDVLKTAERNGAQAWAGRAKGELSICEFLAGDYKLAKKLSDDALRIAVASGDAASEVRQRSLKAVTLLEQRRYDEAEALVERAIVVARNTPNIRFPVMAYQVKADLLTVRSKPKEADTLLDHVAEYLDKANLRVYLADLYLYLAQRALRSSNRAKAVKLYQTTATSAEAVGMPRPYSAAHANIARIRYQAGDFEQAKQHIEEALRATDPLPDAYVLPHLLALAGAIAASLQDRERARSYRHRIVHSMDDHHQS